MDSALRAFPLLTLDRDGTRKLFLVMILKNAPRHATRDIEVRMDGSAVHLPDQR